MEHVDPQSPFRVFRVFRGPSLLVAALTALAILLPVLWYGPWVPFIDLVAFVGLDSYPPALAAGPHHFEVFQFTYIVPMALSRVCVDFGIGTAAQVSLFYLLQVGLFFFVIWRALERLLPEGLAKYKAIAFGALACWDGLFIWGGPFAYSLAAALLAVVFLLSLREADNEARTAPWPVALLTLLAVASHPFALPFALISIGLRLLFLPRSRWQSGVLLLLLLAYQVVIKRESAEPDPGPLLPQLFEFAPAHWGERLELLFTRDSLFVYQLFGFESAWLNVFFTLLGALHFVGFLLAPVVLLHRGATRPLRLLAALVCAVGLLYFVARENALISFWPQRILTFHSWATYLGGVVFSTWLLTRQWPRLAGLVYPRWATAGVIALVLGFLVMVQGTILRFGPSVEANYASARAALLAAPVSDAVIEVDPEQIRPFFLRCVPFLLFSDAAVIERKLLLYTEWHAQPRHPTRIAEMKLPGGRPHYKAHFMMANGGLMTLALEPVKGP